MINHMIINISTSVNTSTTNNIAGYIQYKRITEPMHYIHPVEAIDSEYIMI